MENSSERVLEVRTLHAVLGYFQGHMLILIDQEVLMSDAHINLDNQHIWKVISVIRFAIEQ